MRPRRSIPGAPALLVLFGAFLFWSSPVLADCIDHHDCICPPAYAPTAPVRVWGGEVTSAVPVSGPYAEITIRITRVTLPSGEEDLQDPSLGQERMLPGSHRDLGVGATVMVAIDQVGTILMPVVPVATGDKVGCEYVDGFSIDRAQAIAAMLAPDCSQRLDDAGLTAPPCNDTLIACGCTSAERTSAPWGWALPLALFTRRRR